MEQILYLSNFYFLKLNNALLVYGGEGMRVIEFAYSGEYFVKTDPVVYRATIEPEKQ